MWVLSCTGADLEAFSALFGNAAAPLMPCFQCVREGAILNHSAVMTGVAKGDPMLLEHLCDMELVYQEAPVLGQMFVMVRPYGGEEGTGYGEGVGTVTGPKLNGKLRWVNHPHRRSDEVMLPNLHGVILTDDGAAVMFNLQGRTFFEGAIGKQLLLVNLEAEDQRYAWLNMTLCVLEGLIDRERFSMKARVYACIHDLA
jgi:hypothetical protein